MTATAIFGAYYLQSKGNYSRWSDLTNAIKFSWSTYFGNRHDLLLRTISPRQEAAWLLFKRGL